MPKNQKTLLNFWEDQMRQSHTSSNYFFRKSPSHYHMMLLVMSAYKEGTKLSWWNSCKDEKNIYGIEDVTYEYIPVRPPRNHYFKSTVYFLPKKQY